MQNPEIAGTKKTAAQVEQDLSVRATSALKVLKARSGLSFSQISRALAEREMGTETPGQLKAKFRRGKFSYAFFLRMLVVMNVVEGKFFDVPQPKPDAVPKGFNLKMYFDRLPVEPKAE